MDPLARESGEQLIISWLSPALRLVILGRSFTGVLLRFTPGFILSPAAQALSNC
jgi:hypothetical protein